MPVPPASGLPPLARAIAALAPFGQDARRRERFLAAREQGCCHQCHAPLQNLLNDCPCPHWFITSASTVERIAPVLRMYALSDVLHFLLLHVEAGNAGRAPTSSQLAALARRDGYELKVRLGRKQWSFRTTQAGEDGGRLVVELFNPRTGKHCAIDLPASGVDLDVMDAVTQAIGGG
ncbi:hypothetical protein OU994_08245 [Pseudoduganella sp. SL102]|uniref:hypothetical protein n=1 Tax=Pseudoduganella sp. SL102 TaxID=2995154 RepID=UPI00248AA5D1|nr:hypothetical protein [Pseudoduganella sp. SL102]WBS04256.1 hypothetical protein OU994_08245 [Pseudoduganella sp. SL102]